MQHMASPQILCVSDFIEKTGKTWVETIIFYQCLFYISFNDCMAVLEENVFVGNAYKY